MALLTHPGERIQPAFSVPSILAIICALASFFFGAGLGVLLAVVAVILGAVGVIAALSPSVRGGVTSMFSMVVGIIGIVVALLKLLF